MIRNELTQREYEIITKRYGLNKEKEITQREVAYWVFTSKVSTYVGTLLLTYLFFVLKLMIVIESRKCETKERLKNGNV